MSSDLHYYVAVVLACSNVDRTRLAEYIVDSLMVSRHDGDGCIEVSFESPPPLVPATPNNVCHLLFGTDNPEVYREGTIDVEIGDRRYRRVKDGQWWPRDEFVWRMRAYVSTPDQCDSYKQKARSLFRVYGTQCANFRQRSPNRHVLSRMNSPMTESSYRALATLSASDDVCSFNRNEKPAEASSSDEHHAALDDVSSHRRFLSQSMTDIELMCEQEPLDSACDRRSQVWVDCLSLRVLQMCLRRVPLEKWHILCTDEPELIESLVDSAEEFVFVALSIGRLPAVDIMQLSSSFDVLERVCNDLSASSLSLCVGQMGGAPREMVEWVVDNCTRDIDDYPDVRNIRDRILRKPAYFTNKKMVFSETTSRHYDACGTVPGRTRFFADVAITALVYFCEMCKISDFDAFGAMMQQFARTDTTSCPRLQVVESVSTSSNNHNSSELSSVKRRDEDAPVLVTSSSSDMHLIIPHIYKLGYDKNDGTSRMFKMVWRQGEHPPTSDALLRMLRCAARKCQLDARTSVRAFNPLTAYIDTRVGNISRYGSGDGVQVVVFRYGGGGVGAYFRTASIFRLLMHVSPIQSALLCPRGVPHDAMCGYHCFTVADTFGALLAFSDGDDARTRRVQCFSALRALSALLCGRDLPSHVCEIADELVLVLTTIINSYMCANSNKCSVPEVYLSNVFTIERDTHPLALFLANVLRWVRAPCEIRLNVRAAQIMHDEMVRDSHDRFPALRTILSLQLRHTYRDAVPLDTIRPYRRLASGQYAHGVSPEKALYLVLAYAASGDDRSRISVESLSIPASQWANTDDCRTSSTHYVRMCDDYYSAYRGSPLPWSRNAPRRIWTAIFSALLCTDKNAPDVDVGATRGTIQRRVRCSDAWSEMELNSQPPMSAAEVSTRVMFGKFVCGEQCVENHDAAPRSLLCAASSCHLQTRGALFACDDKKCSWCTEVSRSSRASIFWTLRDECHGERVSLTKKCSF